jgi:FHA domain
VATQLEVARDPVAPHSLSPRELREVLAAERVGRPFLCFRDEQGCLALFELVRESTPIAIGRRPETDLSFPSDNEISGLHAELECLGGEWTILDDGLSRNGTHVNGKRINGRQRLRDGDRIRLGRTVLAYNAAQAAASGTTINAGEIALPQLTDTQRRVLIALCRPYRDTASFAAAPASNQQIADEVFLSVDAVKMHLRRLFARLELDDLPQNQKRARLAEYSLQFGLISQREIN